MSYRIKMFTMLFLFCLCFTATLLVLNCSSREGEILGIQPIETAQLVADSFWTSYDFTSSTGTIRCLTNIKFDNYTLLTGLSKDSLCENTISDSLLFFSDLKCNQVVYYAITVISKDSDSTVIFDSLSAPSGFPPSIPENIMATGSFSGVKISWDHYSDPSTAYTVYRSLSADGEFKLLTITDNTEFLDTSVNYDFYWYKVSSMNSFGETRSNQIASGSKIIALAPPNSLTASNGSHYHQIHLLWESNPDADRYNIFRADSANSCYNLIAKAVKDTTFIDTVKKLKTYYYKVSSMDKSGRSGPLGDYAAGLSQIQLPAPVVKDVSKGDYDDRIYIYWKNVDYAIDYVIYRSEDNETYSLLTTTNDTFFIDFVKSSRPYFYEISTFSSDSIESARSMFEFGYVKEVKIPENLKIVESSGPCILLTWDSVSEATSYNIYKTNNLSSDFSLIATSDTNLYCDEVPSASVWYYSVTAVNKNEIESYYSNLVHGEGPSLTDPNGFTASQGTYQEYVELKWNPVPNAAGYHLYRSMPSSGYSIVSSKISSTEFKDFFAADTNYYQVCAVDSSGSEGILSPVITGYPAPLDTIVNLKGSADIPNLIQLSWTEVKSFKYLVYFSRVITGPYLPIDSVDIPVFYDTSHQSGYFKVAVLYNSRIGRLSNSIHAAKMNAPGHIFYNVERNGLFLKWNSTNGATSYNIYKSHNGTPYSVIKNTADTFYVDTSVIEGTNNYYITSANSNGEAFGENLISIKFVKGVESINVTVNHDTLLICWPSIVSADSFRIYRSNFPDSNFVFYESATDTSVRIIFNQSGKFYYKVQTFINNAVSAFSNIDSGTVIARPKVPDLISAESGNKVISLEWQEDESGEKADYFIIYRSPNYSSGYNAIDTISGTIYTDTPPSVNTYYYYSVAAINSSGASLKSNYLAAVALPLLSPQSVTASTSYGTHIMVSWNKVSEAEKYLVARETGSLLSPNIVWVSSDTFFIDTAAQAYRYYFIASVQGSDTTWSSYALGYCLQPTTSISASGFSNYIRVTWNSTSNTNRYYIYRSRFSDAPYVKIDSSTSLQYYDSVKEAGSYYYKISSMNLSESELSSTYASARLVAPAYPAAIYASQGVYFDSIKVWWNEVAGANNYIVYRSNSINFEDPVVVKETADTVFYDSVKSDTVYYYKIKSVNIAGIESVLGYTKASGYRVPSLVPKAVTYFSINSYSNYIGLEWNGSPDIPYKGFYIYRSESSESGPFTKVDSTSATYYYDYVQKSFPSQYWYFVKSYNKRGESISSDTLVGSRSY